MGFNPLLHPSGNNGSLSLSQSFHPHGSTNKRIGRLLLSACRADLRARISAQHGTTLWLLPHSDPGCQGTDLGLRLDSLVFSYKGRDTFSRDASGLPTKAVFK